MKIEIDVKESFISKPFYKPDFSLPAHQIFLLYQEDKYFSY